MAEQPKNSDWIYVAVEDPELSAGYVAYKDEPSGVSYIPAFYRKDAAQACFINLPRERGKKYEIQAVMFDVLARDAAANHFSIFMLDGEGHILLKIDSATITG